MQTRFREHLQQTRTSLSNTVHTLQEHPFLFVLSVALVWIMTTSSQQFGVIEDLILLLLSRDPTGIPVDLATKLGTIALMGVITGAIYGIIYPLLKTYDTGSNDLKSALPAIKKHAPVFLSLGVFIILLTVFARISAALVLTTGALSIHTLMSLTTEVLVGRSIPIPESITLAAILVVRGLTLVIVSPLFVLYPVLCIDSAIDRPIREIPVLAAHYAYKNPVVIFIGSFVFFLPEVLLQAVRFSPILQDTHPWTIAIVVSGVLKVASLVFLYEWYTNTIQPDVHNTHQVLGSVSTWETWRPVVHGVLIFALVSASVGAVRVADPDFNQPEIEERGEFAANGTAADAFDNKKGYSLQNRGIEHYNRKSYESENTFHSEKRNVDNADHHITSRTYIEYVDDRNEQYMNTITSGEEYYDEEPGPKTPQTIEGIYYVGSDGAYYQTDTTEVDTWHSPYDEVTLEYYGLDLYNRQSTIPGILSGGIARGNVFDDSRWERTNQNETHVVFETDSVEAMEPRMETNLLEAEPWKQTDGWDTVVGGKQQSQSAHGVVVVNKSNGLPVSAQYTYTATYQITFLESSDGQERKVTRTVTETQKQAYRYSYGEPVPAPDRSVNPIRRALIDAIFFTD